MALLSRRALQKLAQDRLEEGRLLLDAGRWGGCFYLAGYSMELGLKACIAKQFVDEVIPAWAATERFKTHGLRMLLEFAGLEDELKQASRSNEALQANWDVVIRWRTDRRYDGSIDERTAWELMEALDHPADGVFTWIKTRW